ncbi:MAG TPA: dihydroxyacetone kinase subunit DhaL [Burkholderiaceae bacterium]|nr:dihydroxyacetone kinase subunit DhaL [Burkholderiaceae bacterium]
MDTTQARRIIESIARSVIAHADELTQLDQAIGDGDHGVNMKRGFEAVLADLDSLAAGDVGALLNGVGRTLVMKVGGASGPLYGTLFMQLGKTWPPDLTAGSLHATCQAAIDAVAARGKSRRGQKTLLDVLVPVCDELGAGAGRAALRAFSAASAQATVPMEATRGRASFLKERSIGHLDPGARSAQLMIEAVCDSLESAG